MSKKRRSLNFASGGKASALTTEIATRARSIDFSFFGGFLPNPDPILKKMGKDQLVYEEIQGDAHLSGVIGQRTSGVKSLLWDLDRGKAKSRPVKAILKAFILLDLDALFNEILQANYRGYQPLEIMWAQPNREGFIMPAAVVGKPPEWFHYDEENNLRFRTLQSYTGEELPLRKFLIPRRQASFKNPYGDALLSKCYWPAVFKRSGLKFWVTFTEKYGIPYAIGKLPRASGQAEFDKLAADLEAMVQDAVAAIPSDASVEILEPAGKAASAEIFEKLVKWADDSMSKAIIGHSGGADSTPGKLGGEDNAVEVKEYLVMEDKRLIEATMNQLIRWICEINFGAGEAPTFTMYEEEDVDLVQSERDKNLSDQGVQFSKDYYTRTYGFEEGDIVAVTAPKPAAPPLGSPPKPGPAFAEKFRTSITPDQAALDAFADGLDPNVLQAQADGMLKPLVAMVKAGASLEDIREKLAGTFEDLDSKSLEKMLQRAIFVSELLGRAGSEAQRGK